MSGDTQTEPARASHPAAAHDAAAGRRRQPSARSCSRLVDRHQRTGFGGSMDLAGHSAEPRRSDPKLPEPPVGTGAPAEHRRDAEAGADWVRPRGARRRSAGHCRRRLACARGRRCADRAVRPQPAGRRADPADDSLVRDRRDAEGDVHLHRLRSVRLLGCRSGCRWRAGSICRDGADARARRRTRWC